VREGDSKSERDGLTAAAAYRLHMAQPSLSRQIRDLEAEIGVQLPIRGAPAGRINDGWSCSDVFVPAETGWLSNERSAATPAAPAISAAYTELI
jgi:LysR family hca operon transcriptional activator